MNTYRIRQAACVLLALVTAAASLAPCARRTSIKPSLGTVARDERTEGIGEPEQTTAPTDTDAPSVPVYTGVPAEGQYVTAYLSAQIYDLDPTRAASDEVSRVIGLMFDPVLCTDENGEIVGGLAESCEVTVDPADGRTLVVLRLRDTAWSDSVPLTAQDLLYAWQRILNVGNAFEVASLLYDVENARAIKEGDASIDDIGVAVKDSRTVEIRLAEGGRVERLLHNLGCVALTPLREDVVEKGDDWAKKPGTLATSGRFRLARVGFEKTDRTFGESQAREQVITDFVLEKNYYYHDVHTDASVPYRIAVDCTLTPEELSSAFEAGAVLYVGDVPLALRREGVIADAVKQADRSFATTAVYLNQNALITDGGDGQYLFADARVRQALSMAIDRAALADAAVYAEPATGLLPTGISDGGDGPATFRESCNTVYETLATDPDAARSLLEDAGIEPSDYSFTVTCAAYDEVQVLFAEQVASAWRSLGFGVTVRMLGTIPNDDYYAPTESIPRDLCDDLYAEAMRAGDFEVAVTDICASVTDPYAMLSLFAKSYAGRGMIFGVTGDYLLPHVTGYDSEAYAALIDALFSETDGARRAALCRDAEAMLMADMPIIPLTFDLGAVAVSPLLDHAGMSELGGFALSHAVVTDYAAYVAAGYGHLTAALPHRQDAPVWAHFFLPEDHE